MTDVEVPIGLGRKACTDDALVDGGMLCLELGSVLGPFKLSALEGVACGDGGGGCFGCHDGMFCVAVYIEANVSTIVAMPLRKALCRCRC